MHPLRDAPRTCMPALCALAHVSTAEKRLQLIEFALLDEKTLAERRGCFETGSKAVSERACDRMRVDRIAAAAISLTLASTHINVALAVLRNCKLDVKPHGVTH